MSATCCKIQNSLYILICELKIKACWFNVPIQDEGTKIHIRLYNNSNRAFYVNRKGRNKYVYRRSTIFTSYSIFCSLLLFLTVDRRLMSYTGPYVLILSAEIICNWIIGCFMIRLSFKGKQQREIKLKCLALRFNTWLETQTCQLGGSIEAQQLCIKLLSL